MRKMRYTAGCAKHNPMITDFRVLLKDIADELPADNQARGFLLEAVDKLNGIYPLDPYHMEVMDEPAMLIRKAYELVEDDGLKAKLRFAVMVSEHRGQKSGTP